MKPTFNQRLRYRFDNLMAHGTPAMIGMLFVFSLVIIFVAGATLSITHFVQNGETEPLGFFEASWMSLMRTLDSGTMGGDTGTGFRAVMLMVTLGGIFIVSALIGVLNNAIENQMERMRKGRSKVLESNHTLVLGWSSQIFTIINELMIANEDQDQARIVILASKDKMEMEDDIRERVEFKGKTRIICRHGSPFDPNDLEIASPHHAKSIIVLPPENDDPDIDVIKTVLAITNNPNRRAEPYHIITQIRNPHNMGVLKLVGEKDNVQAVMTGDLIARIVAQTSRQSGLSVVYTELLDFDGDEIYFKSEPSLTGKTFGETLLAYHDSCVMGIRKANGQIILNPPMDSRIESNDKIVALSADNDTIALSALNPLALDESLIRSNQRALQSQPEKCLILGWNRSGTTIVHELENYVTKGSKVTVVSNIDSLEKEIFSHDSQLENQELTVVKGQTTDRELLNKLNVANYDHVIVLADDTIGQQQADAQTLVTLLHLREMAQKDETPFSIVSEMLDLRNRKLAEATKVDDFIVSEHLVSLMMSQISENSELFSVFNDIFDPEGAEIYLKPASDYVATGQPVNFYTVVEAARRRGETALGYRITAEANASGKSYGVYTNPKKSSPITFTAEDKVIVIAQD
jgi:voltage-gated potassium channel Kch